MTDEEKIAAAVAAAMKQMNAAAPIVQVPAKPAVGASAVEMLFRSLVGVCAAGIGWVVITMPVMQENLKSMKEDIARIEANTNDRFTRQDFLREIEPLRNQVNRANAQLDERTQFMTDTRERLTKLEERME